MHSCEYDVFLEHGALVAKTDAAFVVCVRLHRRLYFSLFYSAAVLRTLRSTVISVCTALFMTRTAAADCTTLAHAEEEKERGRRGQEKERERRFRCPCSTLAIKMLLPPPNKYLFTSCYIFHLTTFD